MVTTDGIARAATPRDIMFAGKKATSARQRRAKIGRSVCSYANRWTILPLLRLIACVSKLAANDRNVSRDSVLTNTRYAFSSSRLDRAESRPRIYVSPPRSLRGEEIEHPQEF